MKQVENEHENTYPCTFDVVIDNNIPSTVPWCSTAASVKLSMNFFASPPVDDCVSLSSQFVAMENAESGDEQVTTLKLSQPSKK